MRKNCAWYMNSCPGKQKNSDLPAWLTKLLNIDGAAQGDDKYWEALRGQAVVANHSI